MATHSSILAWRIPWTEEASGIQSIGSQRVGHDWSGLVCISYISNFDMLNFLCLKGFFYFPFYFFFNSLIIQECVVITQICNFYICEFFICCYWFLVSLHCAHKINSMWFICLKFPKTLLPKMIYSREYFMCS